MCTNTDTFALLESIVEEKNAHNSTKHNYCCGQPMATGMIEYSCVSCGRIKTIDNASTCAAARIGGGRYYGGTDYADTQYTHLMKQLRNNVANWTGNSFPEDVLAETAKIYNSLQRMNPDFVKRGNTKTEIMASILYHICQQRGINHKRKNVAAFMRLDKGFARGDAVVMRMMAEGILPNLVVQNLPIQGFADRYLEALSIDTPENKNFVVSLVTLSEENMIGMNSHISSKVVGAIWILQQKLKLNIPPKRLEIISDGTKKNTFMKFVLAVEKYKDLFSEVHIATP